MNTLASTTSTVARARIPEHDRRGAEANTPFAALAECGGRDASNEEDDRELESMLLLLLLSLALYVLLSGGTELASIGIT